MKYLNLTEGFNPYNVHPEGVDLIKFDSFTFSGGEPHIKILSEFPQGSSQEVMVTIRIKSFNDMGLLFVAMEALSQTGWLGTKRLFLPYFPGARQDRRMVPGEPLTVKVYAQMVNDLDFAEVEIFDPHSDVTPALLDNVQVINNHGFVKECLTHIVKLPRNWGNEYSLISPDAGSNKKMYELTAAIDTQGYVRCDKHRKIGRASCRERV